MLSKVISFSVRNKFLIILFTLALVGLGIYSMLNVSIDAVPDITNNQVQIVTTSPSLAAQEVEQFITYPIEMEMANVQHVEEIRSISRYGLSVVTVVFKENVDVLDARQLVGQQLQIARQEIPEGYGEPSLMPITTGLGEIYQYTLDVKPGYEDKYDPMELRTIHDWIVKRQLNGIPGIVEISSFGGFVKEYVVAVDPNLISSYNITLLDVNNALQQNNQNTGGSYVQKGPYAYYIRTNGLIKDFEDIKNIVVTTKNNIPVCIGNIAEVSFGYPPRFGAMTKDGKGEAVGGITLMLKGGNASQVIKEVKERIEQIRKNLPEGIDIVPYLDRSSLVNNVIKTVRTNLIEGGLIVIFILVLLLGNFRAGLIVASVIPLSMLFAFTMMKAFGVTATVMSLGAIDFGLIVDATVIIVESIVFQIEKSKKKLSAADVDDLTLSTTLRIRNSAAFGAIIILIVYFPILALSGIEGKMFKPMALTVGFAIIGALILSFTYIPVVSALFLKQKKHNKKTVADRIMDLFYRSYKPVFNLALRFKPVVLFTAILLFVSSLVVFNYLGAEFLPDLDEGDFAMQMTIPPGSSLSESVNTSTKAERILLDNFPEVKTVISKIGTAEVPTDPMAIEDADIMIILKPRKEWTSARTRDELADKMKEKLNVIAGAGFEFTQPIQLRFNELLTGAKTDVAIKIYGDDLEVLFDKANEAAGIIASVQGAADIKVEQIEGLPQLIIDYKRERMALYGLNIEEVNTMIRTALAGERVGVVFEGQRKFDLVVRLKEEYRSSFTDFSNLYIKTPLGNQVPLNEIASIGFADSPAQVSRDNTHRRISVGVNVRNRDVQSLVEEINEKLEAKLILPSGYYITYGGKFENLQSAMQRLRIVVPIALILIFILLYFAFSSLSQAFMIFMTIPLSIIGGIFSLWIRGLPFSISAGIGFIALFGVAVLDGIVLVNHLNELKLKGIVDIHERLKLGTKNRLRPVIITSAVASLGFLPMAISTTAGAEVQRPLATVVIGGIITSTFLTMIVLPLAYYYFEKGFRTKNIKTAVTALLIFFSIPALAQDEIPVSIEKAVSIVKHNNPVLKNAELLIEKNNFLKKSTLDFGDTEFDYQSGQINSAEQDYNITLRQNFNNPLFNIKENEYFKTGINLAESHYLEKENEIIYELKKSFYLWQSLKHQINLIDTFLIRFEKSIQLADLQHEKGEINYLSKLSMENLYNKYVILEKKKKSQLLEAQLNFQSFLFSDTIFVPLMDMDNKLILAINNENVSDIVTSSPAVRSMEIKSDLMQKNVSLQRSLFFPDIHAGWFNQQIDGNKGFTGWEAGISLPLLGFSQHNKVRSSKIDAEIAENEHSYFINNTIKEVEVLFENYDQQSDEINYYESTALPGAWRAAESAELLFEKGEIGYFEFIRTTEDAMNWKLTYYEKLFELNKTILTIKYLTGK
jgi:cobalt-zinc-cadmium resistance protein CzcA